MKISKSTIAALSTVSVVRAFSTKNHVLSNKAVADGLLRGRGSFAGVSRHNKVVSVGSSSTALPMIFDKFFSSLGGGGGYASAIDYSAIPFPVPELAVASQEGKSLETIERNGKRYNLATFAGMCIVSLMKFDFTTCMTAQK